MKRFFFIIIWRDRHIAISVENLTDNKIIICTCCTELCNLHTGVQILGGRFQWTVLFSYSDKMKENPFCVQVGIRSKDNNLFSEGNKFGMHRPTVLQYWKYWYRTDTLSFPPIPFILYDLCWLLIGYNYNKYSLYQILTLRRLIYKL